MLFARLAVTALACLATASAPLLAQEGDRLAQADERFAYVRMDTSLGELIFELDRERAPISVANFAAYVDEGFYDGLMFHRVLGDMMAQAGGFEPGLVHRAPTRAPIRNESDNGLQNAIGSLAMVRGSDPHDATSQFFINLADNPQLDKQGEGGWGYAVFGKVIGGMDTLFAIRGAEVESDARVDKDTPAAPVTPIVIHKAVQVPATACADHIAQARSAERDVVEVPDVRVAVARARETQDDEILAFVNALNLDVDSLQYEPNGLGSIVLTRGSGKQPSRADRVSVHYTGYLLDGSVFDSSRERGEPSVFGLNKVIKGWSQGVGQMQVGERRLLVIPPSMGYGSKGIDGVIPPDATLAFDVELLDITDYTSMEAGKKQLERVSDLFAADGVTTPSGLFYVDEVVGEGATPQRSDRVQVHYTGWLVDGTRFDGSRTGRNGLEGKPLKFGVTGVIKGWTEALLSMNVGTKRWVVIPGDLAYGPTGRGRQIPKNAVLVFEMELLDIVGG